MKTKITLTVLVLFIVVFAAFKINDKSAKVDIIKNTFPKEQAEVAKVMDDIMQSIKDKDADKLISFHIYGPKFNEFNNGAPRVGSKENEAFERGFVGAIESIHEWETEDLKIDVFGDVANVTFHANFQPVMNGEIVKVRAQVTLLFVKYKGDWKITHEHHSPLNPTTDG